ncbi:hypothetical protein AA0Y32_04130 [Georgenia phoenicis]|uniref:hypothetical protein n=1 Tax=unclassified Georgenia TaxID=2626815 RepID=UPI0039B06D66
MRLSSARRRILAALAAATLSLAGLAPLAAADEPDVLDASALPPGVHDADLTVGPFTVTATPERTVEVDASAKTGADGTAFTQRLKLGGAGEADYRSVRLSTAGAATLDVHALSSSSGADRALALREVATGAVVAQVPAFGDPGAVIPTQTIEIPAAGDYFLASPASGVNVYGLELRAGAAPDRLPWTDVAPPAVTGVAVDDTDPGLLRVDFTGVVGRDGADYASVTLLDSAGNELDSAMSAAAGGGGSLTLAPAASGSYRVRAALHRQGEEPLVSTAVDAPAFTLPLATPRISSALTTAVADGAAVVTVAWGEVPEAESYSVRYRETGAADYETAAADVTALEAEVAGLVPGAHYELVVVAHRGGEETVSAAYPVTVAAEAERWLLGHAGVGSGGSVTELADGALRFDTREHNGKIADSEDGFHYYYTEIDPETENFTLSATFTVNDAAAKDNQSGFGIVAVDTFVPGDASARYFNSAGAMAAKYVRDVDGTTETRYGTPGGKFVTGYTDAPTVASPTRDMSASAPFDWGYREGYTEGSNANPPRFRAGDVYELTLRRSNTGFHAIWERDGEVEEIIHYDPDLLLQQTQDSFYAGVFVTRKIDVTVSDITFTTVRPEDDDEALEPPTTFVTPRLTADVTRTTPHRSIDVPLVANVHGEVVIADDGGTPVTGPLTLTPGERESVRLPLRAGTNDFTATLTPAPREEQPQLGEYEDLASYAPLAVPLSFTVDGFGEPGQSVWVAPDGTPEGEGTPGAPLDLHTAVAFAQPGQQIVLREGTYRPERAVVVDRGNSGTADAPITLMSEPGTRAVLDLAGSESGGIVLRGDHWHLHDLELTGSQGYRKPLLVQGHHNVVERIESHHNGDTGVQISGSSDEPPSMWPSHNLVLSSVAHNNADPLGNDADGFAAKLTVGEGNVFRYSIAHHNIDDGWDLYAKSTEGPIGAVVVEDSVAYQNGWLEADEELAAVGEGNGFKLGGESMPGRHLLRNSVSYDNYAKGVTSNSGPDVRVHDVTAYHNGQAGQSGGRMNLQLTTGAPVTGYEATGVLSYRGSQADDIVLREQEDTITTDPSNHLDGRGVSDDWFVSLDLSITPRIAPDGSIDMGGLLELTAAAPADTGARLGPNPDPTRLELYPPVTSDADQGDDGGDDGGPGGDGGPDSTRDGEPTADGRGALPVTGAGAVVLLAALAGLLTLGGLGVRRARRG